jgi:hypothetical protein
LLPVLSFSIPTITSYWGSTQDDIDLWQNLVRLAEFFPTLFNVCPSSQTVEYNT